MCTTCGIQSPRFRSTFDNFDEMTEWQECHTDPRLARRKAKKQAAVAEQAEVRPGDGDEWNVRGLAAINSGIFSAIRGTRPEYDAVARLSRKAA